MNKTIPCLIPLLLVGLLACKAESTNNELSQSLSSPSLKPVASSKLGPPIHLFSNYDGVTVVGEEESFDLQVVSGLSGQLTVSLFSKADILLGENYNYTVNVLANEELSIPVKAILPTASTHYISVQATIDDSKNKQSRTFAIALRPPSPTKGETPITQSIGKPENNIIIMEAQENISRTNKHE